MRARMVVLVVFLLLGCSARHQGGGDGSLPPLTAVGTRDAIGYRVLYRFQGGVDGLEPSTSLTRIDGALYGTTEGGGSSGCHRFGCGTVFKIDPSGHERILYRFTGNTDGAGPVGQLAYEDGVLYGTTDAGGTAGGCQSQGCGTVFAASLTGQERILFRFPGGKGGWSPNGGVIMLHGVLFGTTQFGGQASDCINECGTVFSLHESGEERVLHYFHGGHDGFLPQGSLVAIRGSLFGTTLSGGRGWPGGLGCCGSVFSVSTSGDERILYPFYRAPDDGAVLFGSVVDVRGMLYGTTQTGGKTPKSNYRCGSGCGTIFVVDQSGKEQTIYRFKGAPDGKSPEGTLIWDGHRFYGTTLQGGSTDNAVCDGGCGTIFSITPSGKEQILYRFQGGSDGSNPGGSLLLANGMLYGITEGGGGTTACRGGCGTVFALKVAP